MGWILAASYGIRANCLGRKRTFRTLLSLQRGEAEGFHAPQHKQAPYAKLRRTHGEQSFVETLREVAGNVPP